MRLSWIPLVIMDLTSGLCPIPEKIMLLSCLDTYKKSTIFAKVLSYVHPDCPSWLKPPLSHLALKCERKKLAGTSSSYPCCFLSEITWIFIQYLVWFRLYLHPWVFGCQGNTVIVTSAKILAQGCWQVLLVTEVMAYKRGSESKGVVLSSLIGSFFE